MNLKHKEFSLAYLKLKNASKAYAEVYGTDEKKSSSPASRLLRRSDVQAFLAEQESALTKALCQEIAYSRLKSFHYLCHVQERAFEMTPKPDFTAILKAEELKGKLSGLYDKEREETSCIPPVEVIIRS